MRSKSTILSLALAIFFANAEASFAYFAENAASRRAETKLHHLEQNSKQTHPNRSPTEFTEEEINAYFAQGDIELPAGVQSVTFQAAPGVVTASCRVDFDKVKAGRRSANPLLSLFSGIHDVVVAANAHGAAGQGYVEVQSVSLDGVEIPRFVLELFVEKYLQPRYPNIGIDSQFPLPQKIDTAIVGSQKLTVFQK